ncbi:hypothetical protein GGR51DRAFT_569033 [Nemania sp. FL0031]|nr:hypothetical protein GGR51DRAFT_569033 [Nemania sp. FL0031]
MSSTPPQGSGSSESTPSSSPTTFTGDSRLPFRERMQRMRGGKKGAPAPLRSETSTPSKRTSSGPTKTPRTPRSPRSTLIPEVPSAPRKGAAYGIRRLSEYDENHTDEDILLDKKANEKAARQSPMLFDMNRHRGYDTPDRPSPSPSPSPLRQSWGPDELAELSAKLRDFNGFADSPGGMPEDMPIFYRGLVKKPSLEDTEKARLNKKAE